MRRTVFIIPLTIIFFVFVGITAWFASEGNAFFGFCGIVLISAMSFLALILTPAYFIVTRVLRCDITQKEIEATGLDWNEVSRILRENGVAHQIGIRGPGSHLTPYVIERILTMTVDPERHKERLTEILPELQFKIIFPILKKNWKPLMMKYRWFIAIGAMALFWGLVVLFVIYAPSWLSYVMRYAIV